MSSYELMSFMWILSACFIIFHILISKNNDVNGNSYSGIYVHSPYIHTFKYILSHAPLTLTHTFCVHVSFLLCRVYKNLTCLLSATEAPCLPATPFPPEWPTHPVTMRGRWVGGGGILGGVGGTGGEIVEVWWVGAMKLPLMCPLHSPACDLRAPDSQKVLKHAGVLTLQPHTCQCTNTCSTHTQVS